MVGKWHLDPNYSNAAFIDLHHDKPFFLYVAHFAPHVPLASSKKYLDRFPGEMPERRRYALAMISAIDDGVGRVMQKLKDYDIDENTLVFFIGDNGAPLKLTMPDDPVHLDGAYWDGSKNTPLNGEKGMLSEGGIRVPYVMRWKGTIPSGQVINDPVTSLDVAATSTAVAGIARPENFDGIDLLPMLTKKQPFPERSLTWRFWRQSAIRKGDWKLLKFSDRATYLFDLSKDIGEGRFIQQSYYGDPDGSKWGKKDWVYNPVQGGSYKGEDAKTLDFRLKKNELYAKIEPLRWASAQACPEAIMQESITLDGAVAKIRMRLDYTGPTQQRNAHQELPAMFVDYALPHLMFEKDGKLVKHKPVDLGKNLKPEGISYTGNWLAYVDDNNFGIGIHTPGTDEAVTYRHRGNGSTGPNGSACSYVAPVRKFQLTKGLSFEYKFHLTIGTLDEIRTRFAKLAEVKKEAP